MKIMEYCKKCLYPDTKPQLTFDKNGICSACINNESKNLVDWEKKKLEFIEILEKYKNKNGNKNNTGSSCSS